MICFLHAQRRFPTTYLVHQVQRQGVVVVQAATEISTRCMDHGGNGKSKVEASLEMHGVVLILALSDSTCTYKAGIAFQDIGNEDCEPKSRTRSRGTRITSLVLV